MAPFYENGQSPVDKLYVRGGGHLRIYDARQSSPGPYFHEFKSPDLLPYNHLYRLPIDAPLVDGKVLGCTAAGQMSWVVPPVGVPTSRKVEGELSVTGGGALTADLKLKLLNDEVTPSSNKYYGTGPTGTKGFHALPVSGGTAVEKFYQGTNTTSSVGHRVSLLSVDVAEQGSGCFELTIAGWHNSGATYRGYGYKATGLVTYLGSGVTSGLQIETAPTFFGWMNDSKVVVSITSFYDLKVEVIGDVAGSITWRATLRTTLSD